MSEVLTATGDFERPPQREIERTYLPLFPENFDHLREAAMPIEQLYLSHPSEPFSLRLRETLRGGELVYSATLKDRGNLTPEGLDRLEVETAIDAKTYQTYKALEHALVRKLRYEPTEGLSIDWYEDGHVHVEAERPFALEALSVLHEIPEQHFVDVTGDAFVDNEWRAHVAYRQMNDGKEALLHLDELDVQRITDQLMTMYRSQGRVVATIAGRSGSGKSTVVRELQTQLKNRGLESLVLSTDDYHRGKTWLEQYQGGGPWTQWDAPIVYDLDSLNKDLLQLTSGRTIVKREFDFASEEPVLTEILEVAPVVLIEGIYARDASFESVADLRVEVPTPLATCVGRRLLRDLKERPQFAEPEKSLRYIIEQAEPSWRAQLSD